MNTRDEYLAAVEELERNISQMALAVLCLRRLANEGLFEKPQEEAARGTVR
jgi:hypothetical protein